MQRIRRSSTHGRRRLRASTAWWLLAAVGFAGCAGTDVPAAARDAGRAGAPPSRSASQSTSQSGRQSTSPPPPPIRVDPLARIGESSSVVATLADALEIVARDGGSAPRTIELAPGDHVVARGLRIGAGLPPLVIRAREGEARLVGGLRLDPARLEEPSDAVRARLPEEARDRVRTLAIAPPRAERSRVAEPSSAERGSGRHDGSPAGASHGSGDGSEGDSPHGLWDGGLAGPCHSGHVVEVAAVRSELFVDGRALVPARWPNVGFATIASVSDAGSVPRNAADDVPLAERRSEPPRGGTFVPTERARAARWADAEDAWALGYWNWDWSDEQLPVARVDPGSGAVTLGMPHRYGLAARGRFFVTNVLEELDRPGEYWIDVARGLVHVWPPPDVRGAHEVVDEVAAEVVDVDVDVDDSVAVDEAGNAAESATARATEPLAIGAAAMRPDATPEWFVSMLAAPVFLLEGARDVSFEGLAFEYTRGPAIVARGVDAVRIEGCRFRNLGTHAVDLEGTRSRIARSRFTAVGGIGVDLRGGDRRTLTPSGNAIEDCVFEECGRVLRSYNPAIRLEGVGHVVARNEIAWLPHVAIFMRGNDHRIEANDVHHVVLETGDAGAVYCGRDWTSHGNVVRGNLFHEIRGSDARFQNAVYLDDMASGFEVADNLFVRCNWGILAGGGRDNAIRRNAFIDCGRAIAYDARGVGWMAPHVADPTTSTLHRNLAAMPIGEEPWRSRFPTLASYLTDRFGRPVGSVVEDSVLVGTPFGSIEDRECVRESGTRAVAPQPDDGRGGTRGESPNGIAEATPFADRAVEDARRGTFALEGVRVGPVGPRAQPPGLCGERR